MGEKVSKTARAAEKHKLAQVCLRLCTCGAGPMQAIKFVNERGGKGRMMWCCNNCGIKIPTGGR